ncbi:MAG: hypothetical protein H6811_08375 [Phycisphaeraceae bacterium]|nr:hypothetical protein [Phycisphaeraceae bacterium]
MRSIVCAVSVALCAGLAQGQEFYATNNLSPTNFGLAGDELITYDFDTAVWTSKGVIQTSAGTAYAGLGGLDFNGDGSVLYGSCSFGATPGVLLSINPDTAIATVLGTSVVPMHDLAWNPADGDLYGTDSTGRLWRNVDQPGAEVLVGSYSVGGFLEVGLGFDSAGNVYVHDLVTDRIYKGLAGSLTTLTILYTLPYNSNFSQGTYVDWSHGDTGYHGALNGSLLTAENYRWSTTGGGYGPLASVFATWSNGLPEVEVGDLTRKPEAGGCPDPNECGDWDGSGGQADGTDFFAYLDSFANDDPCADLAAPAGLGGEDFFAFLDRFVVPCP